MSLDPQELERYSRNVLLPEVGPGGQEALKSARVLIVGAGGLGSPAALYLAAAGVGTLGLVDDDAVELSNLQRQVLFVTQDVGARKANAGQSRLEALNPRITARAHPMTLDASSALALIEQYDLVIDGSDRIGTRYLVNDACVISGRPLVCAAVHRFEGQALTYVPGRGPCYRCLFPSANELETESCAAVGVLGVVPGLLGVIQASEALKLTLRIGEPLVGRLLVYDALGSTFSIYPVARDPACAVCGPEPSITRLSQSGATAASTPSPVPSISVEALSQLIERSRGGSVPLSIVDVREPHEYAGGHLPGSRSCPMAELDSVLGSMDAETQVVFVCRTGGRSGHACATARSRGYSRALSLEGGLIRWSRTVDPQLHVV